MRTTTASIGLLMLALASQHCYYWYGSPIAVDASAAGNVAVDSSLEDGRWTTDGGATIQAQSARTGNLGAFIERPTDKTDPRVTGPDFPASPGRWLVSGWLRTAMPASLDPNYSAVLDVTWLDDGGDELGTERAAAVNGYTHVWVYRERVVTAPAGTALGRLIFRFNWSSTGTAELDDVAVTPAAEEQEAVAGVEISLSAAERIFEPGKPLAVRARVRLAEGPARPVKLTMQVADSRGRPITSGVAEVTARSDRPTDVTITASPAEVPLREHLVATVNTDPPQDAGQRFGMLVIPRPTDFSLKHDSPFALLVGHSYWKRWLGARWERPNFNWNEREMELAKRYGVNYVGMFGEADRALRGEMSLQDYGEYVYESVSKFKHMVTYWQLGNEPNLYQPGVPEKWAEILKVGYEAAHRADPDCKVMWGGITGLNVDPDMVDKLLAAGGGDATDIIDIHLYVPIPKMDQLLTKVRADMKKHGVDKPITITEVTGALGTVLPEREKAAHVYKRYAVAESHGVLASWWFVMHWVNTGEFRYCSLIDPGTGEPHEAAAAYARLTDALEGADFVKRLEAEEDAYVYLWRKGDRWIYVAWTEDTILSGFAGLPCGEGEGTITDVAGHQWDVSAKDAISINLRDEPLLIDVPAGDQADAVACPLRQDPGVLSLALGTTNTLPCEDFPGAAVSIDVPRDLSVQMRGNGEAAVTAKPQAQLGKHWATLRYRSDDQTDLAFLRQEINVTPPLRLAFSPLPDSADKNVVLAEVTNLSADGMAVEVSLDAPISTGPRRSRVTMEPRRLAPRSTGRVHLPLDGPVDSLARYDCTLRVTTDSGVSEALTRTLVFTPARRAKQPMTIDGKLDDWPNEFPIRVGLQTGEQMHPKDGPPSGPDDISARAALSWDDANLYMAVHVRDDIHLNEQSAGALWDGDGLQFGFALEPYVASSPYYEWGLALTAQGVEAYAWRAPAGQPTGTISFPCEIRRDDGDTIYEAAIPWGMLPGVNLAPGTTIGFGLCVNEKDTANRGYYCWHAGIAGEKDRARFGQVTLLD